MKKYIFFAVVVLFTIVVILAKNCYYVGFFNDDAYQIIGAQSILAGSLREINHPNQPPFVDYFPGWPLLLAPVVFLTGTSFPLLSFYSIAFSIGSVIVAIFIFKDSMSIYALISLLLLSFFNPLYISLSGTLNQEPAFTFFSLLTILLVSRLHGRTAQADRRNGIVIFYLSIISIIAVLYIRPTGIVLYSALIGYFFFTKQVKKSIIFAAVPLFSISPLLIRNYIIVGTPTTYLNQMNSSFDLLSIKNIAGFLAYLGDHGYFYLKSVFIDTLFRVPAIQSAYLVIFAALLPLTLFITGIVSSKTSLQKYWSYYTVGFVLLHIVWPLKSVRYFYPILPFVSFFIMQGMLYIIAKFKMKPYLVLAPGIISLILSIVPNSTIIRASVLRNNSLSAAPLKTFEWIKLHTGHDDIIASQSGGKVFIYTQRQTIELPPDLKRLNAVKGKVRYYMLESDQMALNKQSIYGTNEYERVLKSFKTVFYDPEESIYMLDLTQAPDHTMNNDND